MGVYQNSATTVFANNYSKVLFCFVIPSAI